jgi:hypothetical protein
MESETVQLKDNQWTVSITKEGFVATNAVQRIVAQDLDTLQVELRKQRFDVPRRDAVVFADPIPAIGATARI